MALLAFALGVFVLAAASKLLYIGGYKDGYRIAADRAGTLYAMKIAEINVALASLPADHAAKIFAPDAPLDRVKEILHQHQVRLMKLSGDMMARQREHHL